MSKTVQISLNEARKLILKAQGLTKSNSFESPLDVVENLGYIQIDTISVVERTHHHTLFSRCRAYQHADLRSMLEKERSVFEYWAHAASYLPMRDYRFSLFRKHEFVKGKGHWYERDKKTMRRVLKRITEEGPLQSKDFDDEFDRPRSAWTWKPAKRALEELFMEGKLMTTARVGFQKVYDLTERVLPSGVDQKRPTKKEFCRYLIQTTLRAQGVAREKEIQYIRRGLQPTLSNVLKEMIAEGSICKVVIEGIDDAYFGLTDYLEETASIAISPEVYILSPFDNLVIQRDRLNTLFEYDYILECYVPEKKRKYGYFCLPILYGEQFVGRMDAKADRKTGTFIVKCIWLEECFLLKDDFLQTFAQSLLNYSTFCGCNQVEVVTTVPASFAKEVIDTLDRL